MVVTLMQYAQTVKMFCELFASKNIKLNDFNAKELSVFFDVKGRNFKETDYKGPIFSDNFFKDIDESLADKMKTYYENLLDLKKKNQINFMYEKLLSMISLMMEQKSL